MDELEIQGKKYISSKRAAEVTGYAKDYVGQLVRTQKVPAIRIGRSWYVDDALVRAHAGLVAAAQPAVSAVAASRTYPLNSIKHREGTPQSLAAWGEVKYLEDTETLTPTLLEKDKSQEVNKNLGQKIYVNKNTSSIDISSERTTKKEEIRVVRRAPNMTTAVSNQQTQHVVKNAPSTVVFSIKLSAAVTLVAFLIILPSVLFLTSQWSYSNSPLLASTSFSFETDFEMIFEYFEDFFAAGVQLIRNFLDLLLNSIAEFYNSGFDYLKNIGQ